MRTRAIAASTLFGSNFNPREKAATPSADAVNFTATSATWMVTLSTLRATNGTPIEVSASYTPAGGFEASQGSLSGGQTVNRRALTVSGRIAIGKPQRQ